MRHIKFLWRLLPIGLRGKIGNLVRSSFDGFYIGKFASSIAKVPPVPRDFCLIGFFSASNGHAIATKLLNLDLRKSGFSPRIIDVSEILQCHLDDGVQTIYEHPRDDDALILVVNPDQIIHVLKRLGPDILANRKIIGYWVWELENPPSNWNIAKGLVHEIWTPSNFSKNSISKIFDCPIKIVPHAIMLNPLPKINEYEAINFRRQLKIAQTDFVAFQSFSFSSSMARKNVFAAIDAFELAFSNNTNAVFVIRYHNSKTFPIALKRLIKKVSEAKSRIVLLEAKGNQGEVFTGYMSANCYISLHRSEGFGLNLAESMQAGLPLICSKWSGNLDFMDETCVCLVETKPIAVIDEDNIYKGKNLIWAEADIAQAAGYLRKIAANPSFARELAIKAQIKVLDCLNGTEFNIE